MKVNQKTDEHILRVLFPSMKESYGIFSARCTIKRQDIYKRYTKPRDIGKYCVLKQSELICIFAFLGSLYM